MTDELIDIRTSAGEVLLAILHEHRRDDAAFAVPLPVAAGIGQVAGSAYVLLGLSALGGAAPSLVQLFDGGLGGLFLAAATVPAGAGFTQTFGVHGIEINSGLYVNTGAALGAASVYLRHKRRGRSTDR